MVSAAPPKLAYNLPMWQRLPPDQKCQLRDHLASFVSPRRLGLIASIVAARTRYLTVVLENIAHPFNASAVLRSCDCFGVQDVHVIEKENTFETVPGITMGAAKWLTVQRYTQTSANTADPTTRCLQQLRAQGYRLAATTLREDSIPIQEVPLDDKVALCYGVEGTGLSDLAHEMADLHVKIPMVGFTQSFNLSVTVALTLYELTTRLRQSSRPWALTPAEQQDVELGMLLNSVREGELVAHRFLQDHGISPDA